MTLKRASAAVQPPIVLPPTAGMTLSQRVFEAVRSQILEGRLLPGTRVPGSRELALQLNVSRNTVISAYEQLHLEGYLVSRERGGTFVAAWVPDNSLLLDGEEKQNSEHFREPIRNKRLPNRFRAPRLYERERDALMFDFRVGRPDADLFPLALWRKLLENRLTGARVDLTRYCDPAGFRDLRAAVASHLRVARGIRAKPEQVIIVRGCQEGLNLMARLFSGPRSTLCIENPCYRGAAFAFDGYAFNLVPVPVDQDGLVVDRLPPEATLVYVTPSHQFPTGATMSLQRRMALLDWAKRSGAYIIEDDYDSDFRYNGSPLTALAGLDSSKNVIYIGTFSKSLGAGIRLGYLVLPESLISAVIDLKGLTDNGTSWLEQAALCDFISEGYFVQHIRRIMKVYRERRDALVSEVNGRFPSWEVFGQDSGMHIAARIPEDLSAQVIQFRAIDAEVGIYSLVEGPAIDLVGNPPGDNFLFFGYPCLPVEKIREACGRLDEILRPDRP